MHVGENQLSPRSFGISPLPTAPLTALQRGTVRASTPSYGRFTLAMGSSRGFGSPACHARPVQTRFRSGCVSQRLTPRHAATRRFILQEARHQAPPRGCPPAGQPSDRSSGCGFRVCFTPLTGVLFTVPSRYSPLSVAPALAPWNVVVPASHQISRVRWYSRLPRREAARSPTGLSPSLTAPPRVLRLRTAPTLPETVARAHGAHNPPDP